MNLSRKGEIELNYFLQRRLAVEEAEKGLQRHQKGSTRQAAGSSRQYLEKSTSCQNLSEEHKSKRLFSAFKSSSQLNHPEGNIPSKANNHNPVQDIVKKNTAEDDRTTEKMDAKHKVVIYFGDSSRNNKRTSASLGDLYHATRLSEPVDSKSRPRVEKEDVMKQLKSVLEEKIKCRAAPIIKSQYQQPPQEPKEKPNAINILPSKPQNIAPKPPVHTAETTSAPAPPPPPPSTTQPIPSFVKCVENGVIHIKVENNFNAASQLVKTIFQDDRQKPGGMASSKEKKSGAGEGEAASTFDWSFVQKWRSRYCEFFRASLFQSGIN